MLFLGLPLMPKNPVGKLLWLTIGFRPFKAPVKAPEKLPLLLPLPLPPLW